MLPWPQVWGRAGSLALTFFAFLLVVHHAMSASVLWAVILALALGRARLRLGGFMRLWESRESAWQILPLLQRAAVRNAKAALKGSVLRRGGFGGVGGATQCYPMWFVERSIVSVSIEAGKPRTADLADQVGSRLTPADGVPREVWPDGRQRRAGLR